MLRRVMRDSPPVEVRHSRVDRGVSGLRHAVLPELHWQGPENRRDICHLDVENLRVTLDAVLRQARPPSPLAGRLSAQSLLFALGEGTFMTGSAVFFTQIVGLSAAQVGLGLTCAGIAAFLAALPMGKLVDRFGPKKMWAVSATGQAAMFALWPFITDFEGYVAMAVGMEVIGALGGAAYGAYTIDVLPPDERVRSRAYMYSALNVGFTLGSLVGRHRAGLPLQRRPPRAAVVHRRGLPGQRRRDQPAAAGRARRPHPGGPQGQDPRARTAAQPRLAPHDLLRRRVLDQPGAAQRRDPAVAGRGDRRPAGAAGLPVRHQHRDVHLPADGGGPRRQGRARPRCGRSGSRRPSSWSPA